MTSTIENKQEVVATMILPASAAALKVTLPDGETYDFVRYPGKLDIPVPRELVNSIFFKGKYRVSGSAASQIEFLVDGTVRGLQPYSRYRIGIDFIAAPDFDYVLMWDESRSKKQDVYHWNLSGDTLRLYATLEDVERMLVVDTLCAALIRK